MKAIDMTKIYGNSTYKGKWVALKDYETRPQVVAYAKNLKGAMAKAKAKGYDMPLMMQIPKKILSFVGSPQIIE